MNGLQAVQDLALFLQKNQSVKVFKFEKTTTFSGEYIVVNHLPFVFSKAVNDANALNVNIHVPTQSSGNANILRLTEIHSDICDLLPFDMECEDVVGTPINGSYYSISSISQPIEDVDNTYFLNLRIKIVTNQIKL